MTVRRALVAVVVLLLSAAGVVLAAGHHPARVAGPAPVTVGTPGATPGRGPGRLQLARNHPDGLRVVALGDSVPSGAACGCEPFPVVYGRRLAAHTGKRVSVTDAGVNGLDSSGLLGQVRDGGSHAARAVAAADVVLVTIGANDFGDRHDEVTEGRCARVAGGDCVSDELQRMSANVRKVLARVRALRAGQLTTVLVTGYWNVFEDGDVARGSFPDAGVAASVSLTRRTNTALSSAAAAGGATYVDLFAPFRSSGTDITGLLASDGDHPSERGHDLIAGVLLAAGLPGLSGR